MANLDEKNIHLFSRLMSLITFFVTIGLEIYAIIVDTKFPYILEIISINFLFILSLLGIRGWLTTKFMSISTMINGNGNSNQNQNTNPEPEQTQNNQQQEESGISVESKFMIKK